MSVSLSIGHLIKTMSYDWHGVNLVQTLFFTLNRKGVFQSEHSFFHTAARFSLFRSNHIIIVALIKPYTALARLAVLLVLSAARRLV